MQIYLYYIFNIFLFIFIYYMYYILYFFIIGEGSNERCANHINCYDLRSVLRPNCSSSYGVVLVNINFIYHKNIYFTKSI